MCDYCNNNKVLMQREFDLVSWFDESSVNITEFGCIIDRGHLRLVDLDDTNCLDHGEKNQD